MSHRFPGKRIARTFVALLIASIMLVQASPNALAQATTGILSGTVTDATTHSPLANVKVSAVAPTGRYDTTTNNAGFYVMTGVYADTYTISFALSGYDPISLPGQNVFAGQTASVNSTMTKALKTIAKVTSRSPGGAFQPRQPIDTYTVTTKGIQDILGATTNVSESTLISSLPGGSLDSSGYPVIRGGRENEENFEFESIPYTDAFTNQFTNSLGVDALSLQSAQLTPGIGNAAADNLGTGTFNLIAKRGSYPGYATFQGQLGGPAFRHGIGADYGFASPNGRISNYFTIFGRGVGTVFSSPTTNCRDVGGCYSTFWQPTRETLDNFVYKFGNNNNQQVQLFFDTEQSNFFSGFGGNFNNICFKTCDPVFWQFVQANDSLFAALFGGIGSIGGGTTTPLTFTSTQGAFGPIGSAVFPNINNLLGCAGVTPTANSGAGGESVGVLGSANANPSVCGLNTYEWDMANLMTLAPGQANTFESLGFANRAPGQQYQPNTAFKLGYMWNINPSANLQVMAFRTNSVTTFDQQMSGGYGTGGFYLTSQGGFTNGLKVDFTKQAGDQHLLRAGAKMIYLHPVFDGPVNNYGVLNGLLNLDYITSSIAWFTPTMCGQLGLTAAGTDCGYIYDTSAQALNCPVACVTTHAMAPGVRIPPGQQNTSLNRTDYGVYIDDTWSPNDKLRVDAGFRVDEAAYHFPTPSMDLSNCTSLYKPFYVFDSSGKLVTQPSTNPNSYTVNPATGFPYTNGQISGATGTAGALAFGYCPKATFNLTNAMSKPVIPEPVISASYQFGPNDSVRAAWGRSPGFISMGGMDFTADQRAFNGTASDPNGFTQIPGDSLYGAGTFGAINGYLCGWLNDQGCNTLAEELYWQNTIWTGGNPLQPARPPVYVNADFSYEHQFTRGVLNGVSFKITPYWRKTQDQNAYSSSPIIAGGQVLTNPSTGAVIFGPSFQSNQGKEQDTGVELQFTRAAQYGLSGQVTVTYQNEQSSVIPLSTSEDFFPTIPPASLNLGNTYRVGFLSPLVATWDLSYQTHSGWRISPQISWNVGYPISPGTTYPVLINGKFLNVPNTNAINLGALGGAITGSTGQYVDPMNPGSFFAPNIAATRGIPMTAAPGGKLSHPNSTTNLVIEYNGQRYWNAGLVVGNIFDEQYGRASLNGRYQPLATGISGPVSGQTANAFSYYTYGFSTNTGRNRFGQNAYSANPSNLRTYYLYLTLKM